MKSKLLESDKYFLVSPAAGKTQYSAMFFLQDKNHSRRGKSHCCWITWSKAQLTAECMSEGLLKECLAKKQPSRESDAKEPFK